MKWLKVPFCSFSLVCAASCPNLTDRNQTFVAEQSFYFYQRVCSYQAAALPKLTTLCSH